MTPTNLGVVLIQNARLCSSAKETAHGMNRQNTIRPDMSAMLKAASVGGVRAFPRLHKLKAHIAAVHSESTFICPTRGCSREHVFDLMRVHLQGHFGLLKDTYPESMTLDRCPLSWCSKFQRNTTSLQKHLQKHKSEDRLDERDLLSQSGYDATTCYLPCPTLSCSETCKHPEAFREYFEYNHMLKVDEL